MKLNHRLKIVPSLPPLSENLLEILYGTVENLMKIDRLILLMVLLGLFYEKLNVKS